MKRRALAGLGLFACLLGLLGGGAFACSSNESRENASGDVGGKSAQGGDVGGAGDASVAGAGGANADEIPAAGGVPNGSLAFGAPCSADVECNAGFCAEFGDGSFHCSVACEANGDCPEGSQGQKCNGRGFCAY
jgi:hypothetical protein